MNPRHRFVIATAATVLLGTVVTLTWHRGGNGAAARPAASSARKPAQWSPTRAVSKSAPNRVGHLGETKPRTATAAGQPQGSSRENFVVRVPKNASPELQVRAARVQYEAREDLVQMSERYHLTPEQQAQIFPILAGASDSFDPRMTIAGLPGGGLSSTSRTPAGLSNPTSLSPQPVAASSATPASTAAPAATVADQVHSVLEPTQQLALATDTVDQQLPATSDDAASDKKLWWQEIISQLQDELDTAIASSSTGAPSDSLSDLLGTTAVMSMPAVTTDGQTTTTDQAPDAPGDDLSILLGE